MSIIRIYNGSDCLVYESEPIQDDKINDTLIVILNELILYDNDKIIIDNI